MKVGDRVMCVDVNWIHSPGCAWAGENAPTLGSVHTIRDLCPKRCLLLEAIVNPLDSDGLECCFYQSHFRKLGDIPAPTPALTARQPVDLSAQG